ncbi:MAG: hypothetical protein RL219_267 [Actinomycetota bacterium]
MPLAVCTLVFAACTDSGKANSSGSDQTTTTSATAADGNGSTDSGSPEAANLLSTALGTLGDTYHFVTTVRVGDVQVLTAEGDRVGAGARLELTSDAGVVSYLITDDGAWARPADGEWAELDVAPATADPIAALGAPKSVSLGASSDGVQVLDAVVTNEALGLTGGGTSTVSVTLVDGRLDQITYTTSENGQAASVTTILSAVRNGDAVVAPV